MNNTSKQKFLTKIKTTFLSFSDFRKEKINIKLLNKKYDPFLLLSKWNKSLFENSHKNQIYFFEIEITVLPSVKPEIEIGLTENQRTEKCNLIDGLKMSSSKKSSYFCTGSLPIFKYRKIFQCEILKIDTLSGNICEMDKIFSKELIGKKKGFKQKPFFSGLSYQWKKKIQHNILSNGFLNLKKIIFYSVKKLCFQCFSYNNSLIRLNFGPEYRYNFRY